MATTPLVVIAGPTASGKTALAVELAEKFEGEIICADSRTIYKGMDIGTAKPTIQERKRVPHWGLDLVEPGERFSAADFKVYAEQKIIEIRKRGNMPFLVGGTGLYIDAILFDYKFGPKANDKLRQNFQKMTIDELQSYCVKNNIKLPSNKDNKRYIIRAIEQKGVNTRRNDKPISASIIVGIATDSTVLRTRIKRRTEQLFENGVVEEAIKLGKKYGWDSEAMTGNIYRLLRLYISGELSISETKKKSIVLDWRLAKRQLVWLRRNQFIHWFSLNEANNYLSRELAAWRKS